MKKNLYSRKETRVHFDESLRQQTCTVYVSEKGKKNHIPCFLCFKPTSFCKWTQTECKQNKSTLLAFHW